MYIIITCKIKVKLFMLYNNLEKKSDFYIINVFNQSTKFQITEIRKVLTLKNGRHLTDAGQWKLKWKCHRNENYPLWGKMQREDSDLDYLLLLSLVDCYSRGKPLPNASFLLGGVRDQRLMLFARYIVL